MEQIKKTEAQFPYEGRTACAIRVSPEADKFFSDYMKNLIKDVAFDAAFADTTLSLVQGKAVFQNTNNSLHTLCNMAAQEIHKQFMDVVQDITPEQFEARNRELCQIAKED